MNGRDADYYIDIIVASDKNVYDNADGKLPDVSGRIWYEVDTANIDGNKGTERIFFSNDGWIFLHSEAGLLRKLAVV